MNKKYIVRLSDEERSTCQSIIKKLTGSSQKVRRAQMLLKADADGPAWTDSRIAEAFNCRIQTLENLRKRVVTESFDLALNGKKRKDPPTAPKLDGQGEANSLPDQPLLVLGSATVARNNANDRHRMGWINFRRADDGNSRNLPVSDVRESRPSFAW